jgi:hypothetical protein
MRLNPLLQSLTLLCLLGASVAAADLLELRDGSRLHGKILQIENGEVVLETAYAGTIKVQQAAVLGFSTDGPVNVALASGSSLLGRVIHQGDQLQIEVEDGTLQTRSDRVRATWQAGGESPQGRALRAEAEALRRRWTYEVSADLAGKSGNTDALGAGAGVRATLAGPQDKLQFSGSYGYQEQNDAKTIDQARGAIDYSAQFSNGWSWYVRSELGRDQIQNLDFFSTNAFGIGRDFIRSEQQTLTGRVGLAYRYESYGTGRTESSPGLDLALLHTARFGFGLINNSISLIPAFDDFADYRLFHESSYEVPISGSEAWKLRIGLTNDYNSRPEPGKEKLDTTYFSRLLFTWR